nr:unnamed protein product [Callosobruchus chinensis]
MQQLCQVCIFKA